MEINKDTYKKMFDSVKDFPPLTEEEEDELEQVGRGYGNLDSVDLKKVIAAGLKPIGITVMMCEETFIFRGKTEALKGWELLCPEGWWYGLGEFIIAREEYVKDIYNGDEDIAPTIHWLDENFRPKLKR